MFNTTWGHLQSQKVILKKVKLVNFGNFCPVFWCLTHKRWEMAHCNKRQVCRAVQIWYLLSYIVIHKHYMHITKLCILQLCLCLSLVGELSLVEEHFLPSWGIPQLRNGLSHSSSWTTHSLSGWEWWCLRWCPVKLCNLHRGHELSKEGWLK